MIGESLADRPKWLGVLIGGSINPKLAEKINDGYRANDNVPIAALTIQRYRGNDGQIYVVTEPIFNSNQSKKNTQKYIFNELELGKSQLVLEVIKSYIASHPQITFNQLVAKFPPNIQGKLGIFDTIDAANEIYTRTGHKRHYIKPEEQLKIADCTIAVSNQWGIGNINKFIDNARKLGYEIKLINA